MSAAADCTEHETFTTEAPELVLGVQPGAARVTMRQARLALLSIGKLDDVDAAIQALPEPAKTTAKIEWEYAAHIEINSPLIQSLAPEIGITESQLKDLFNLAATL